MQSHSRILKTAPPHIAINPSEQPEPTRGLWGSDLHLYSDISLPAKIQTCALFHLSICPWHLIFHLQRSIWKRQKSQQSRILMAQNQVNTWELCHYRRPDYSSSLRGIIPPQEQREAWKPVLKNTLHHGTGYSAGTQVLNHRMNPCAWSSLAWRTTCCPEETAHGYILLVGHEKTGQEPEPRDTWIIFYPWANTKLICSWNQVLVLINQSKSTWNKVTLSQFPKPATQTNETDALAQASHTKIQAKFWMLQEELEHNHRFLHS